MNITFFGTGAAVGPYADNTHFMIEENGKNLLVDAGGGISLEQRMLREEMPSPDALFLTHCHTDHLLGVPHFLRILKKPLTVYLSKNLLEKLNQLFEIVSMQKKINKLINSGIITFVTIEEGVEYDPNGWKLTPINLYSKKAEQFGFTLQTENTKIVFFGDEAIDILGRNDLEKYTEYDALICETFCLEDQAEEFLPHEKSHITAKETGNIAHILQPKKLFVTHYRDVLGLDRKLQSRRIYEEVKSVCDAEIYVPLDGESFVI